MASHEPHGCEDDGGGHEDGVHSIEDPSMAGEQGAHILDPEIPFDERFYKVSHGCGDGRKEREGDAHEDGAVEKEKCSRYSNSHGE